MPRAGGGYYRAVAPVHFYRPYYSFRPYISLGFGLWAGYPFAYNYSVGFYDPYYAAYPAYAYPAYPAYPAYETYPADPAFPATQPYPAAGYPPEQSSPGYGSVHVQPGSQLSEGGLSFDITPATAEVFVDGSSVGTVGQFTPTSQPVGLPAGRHHVEIRAPGYRTMSFDADIVGGQVIPYQGAMER